MRPLQSVELNELEDRLKILTGKIDKILRDIGPGIRDIGLCRDEIVLINEEILTRKNVPVPTVQG